MRSKDIRWWPALAIVLIVGAALGWAWLRDAGSTQERVMPSFPIVFFGAVALFLWLVLFSRLARRTRLIACGAGLVLVALGAGLFEIKGVDGNLVPIVGYRFAAQPAFDSDGRSSRTTAEPARSGPDDYPQFYGPGRLASLAGPPLALDWNQAAPRELWRREIGAGWSSFAVVGAAAVTQEQRGDLEAVVRYDLRSGDQIWVHTYPAAFVTTVGGSGPRATPAIDAGTVYTLGATGVLNALALDSGELIWSRNVLEDHGAGQPVWGMASSPLVVGEHVLVQLGPSGKGLAAYRRGDGTPAWRQGDDAGTYSSPLLAELAGAQQVLVVNHDSVTGHDPASGAVLWRHAWPNGGERVSMPLVLDENRLLVSAGYGQGSRLLRIHADPPGYRVELEWEGRRLKSKFAPIVQYRGVIYGLDDGVMVAIDPADGERFWKGGRYGHGQFVLVGGLLVVQAESGEIVLVEASPDAHREVARLAALSGKTWNPPALTGRILLVRNDREAVAYELATAVRSSSRSAASIGSGANCSSRSTIRVTSSNSK